jgi:ABC-2 type transport system permease protein
MYKILRVARREYIETVKTKTFLIGILVTPLIVGGIILFTKSAAKGEQGPRPAVRVGITVTSTTLTKRINAAFQEHNESNPQRQIIVKEIDGGEDWDSAQRHGKDGLRKGRLDAYLVLDENIVEGAGVIRFYTHKPKAANLDAFWTIESIVNRVIVKRRCELRDLSPQLLASLRNVPIERVELVAGKEERVKSDAETVMGMMVPFFFMFLIYAGTVGMAQHMLSSVIEEKNSRVIEVLLSALSPLELMSGKIVGLAGVGLTVMGLWAGAAYLVARRQGLDIPVTGELLAYFVLYYILGFVLFSTILAGLGSICNTLKETQSLMTPLVLLSIIPLLAWVKLVQSPDGLLARLLSFVPPLTPMVMVLRLAAGSDVWVVEIVASIVVLVVAVLAAMWLAARVFRIGILMYGKKPGLRHVWHWLREA